jgi:hypothetical protein
MPSINIARIASRSSADSLGAIGLGTTVTLELLSGVGGKTGMIWDEMFREGCYGRICSLEENFGEKIFWGEGLFVIMFLLSVVNLGVCGGECSEAAVGYCAHVLQWVQIALIFFQVLGIPCLPPGIDFFHVLLLSFIQR